MVMSLPVGSNAVGKHTLVLEVPNGTRHRYSYDVLENKGTVDALDEEENVVSSTADYQDSVLRVTRDIMSTIEEKCNYFLNMINQSHTITRLIVDFVLVKKMKQDKNGRMIYITDVIMALKSTSNPKIMARFTAPTELFYFIVKDLQPDSIIYYGENEGPVLEALFSRTIMSGFIPSMINKHQFVYSFLVCRNTGPRRIRRFAYRNTVNLLRVIVQRDILEEGLSNIVSFVENGALLSQLPVKLMDSALTGSNFRELRKNIVLLYENVKYGNMLSIFLLEICGFLHIHDNMDVYTCRSFVEFAIANAKRIRNIIIEKHKMCTPESEDLLALTDKIVNIDTIYDKIEQVATT